MFNRIIIAGRMAIDRRRLEREMVVADPLFDEVI
jgi:hypothetical protein